MAGTHKTTAFTDGTSSDAVQSMFNTILLVRGVFPVVAQIPVLKRTMAQRQGKTIIWRRYETLSLATTALTEGVTPSGITKTKTDVSATLAPFGDFIEDSDFLLGSQPENVQVENAELLGQQLRETMDKLYMNEWATQTTNIIFANGAATASVNTVTDLNDFKRAYRTLKNGKAREWTPMVMSSQNVGTGPIQPAYWAIVTESMMFDISAFSGFLLAAEYGRTQGIIQGERGAIKQGIRFLVVPDTAGETSAGGGATGGSGIQETSDSADVHSAFVMGQDAMGGVNLAIGNGGVIRKPLGSAGSADPLDQRSTIGWKKYDAREFLNENFSVEVQGAVTN